MTTLAVDSFVAADEALNTHKKAFIAYQNTLCVWVAPDGSVLIDTYPNLLLAKQNWES